jgi:xanthine phosphoribosyltransferase
VLIVDDLADTGKTAKVVRELLQARISPRSCQADGLADGRHLVTEVSRTPDLLSWDTGRAFQPPIREGGAQSVSRCGHSR